MHGIARLHELENLNLSSVGRMGQTLGSLAQRQASVAPSFVVTTSALKEFVILSGIRDRVFSLLKARDAEALHDLLLNQHVPDDLEEDLFMHCSGLKSDQFICRSSSAFLDHEYDQCAQSKHKVLDAIKGCWASVVTSDRIGTLNKSNLFSAVVVQPSPAGAKKGRLYTVNPMTNSKEKILIELCEPKKHMLLVNRGDSKVINEDDFRTVQSPLFIDEKDALVELAAQVGALFRRPQTVEWTQLGKEMVITRVSEFDTAEKMRFTQRLKESGSELAKVPISE